MIARLLAFAVMVLAAALPARAEVFESRAAHAILLDAETDTILFAKDAEVRLIYVLAHESEAAAAKSWAAFRVDPEWLKVKAESEKDGVLVKKVDVTFMNATDYSPK